MKLKLYIQNTASLLNWLQIWSVLINCFNENPWGLCIIVKIATFLSLNSFCILINTVKFKHNFNNKPMNVDWVRLNLNLDFFVKVSSYI